MLERGFLLLVGLVGKVGISTSFRAELWCVMVDLQLPWDRGFRRTILDVDCWQVRTLFVIYCYSRSENCFIDNGWLTSGINGGR